MNVDIIGVPIDLGANRRGVDMGPSAIRYAGLKKALLDLNIDVNDLGNVSVPVLENIEVDNNRLKHINEINKVNKTVFEMMSKSISRGNIPLVLGGDHSIAAGTIMASQASFGDIGVIWMDAHGDFNTEKTTRSGNLHGMSLAACTGIGAREMISFISNNVNYIDPQKIALIGVRCLDKEEAKLLIKSKVNVYTMSDIDSFGIKKVIKDALKVVESKANGFHLSFDMDVITPNEAPGVGTPVSGGLTYREAHLALEMISESKKLRSIEFVELNPILDHENKTGQLAVSLICSLLGKKILSM